MPVIFLTATTFQMSVRAMREGAGGFFDQDRAEGGTSSSDHRRLFARDACEREGRARRNELMQAVRELTEREHESSRACGSRTH